MLLFPGEAQNWDRGRGLRGFISSTLSSISVCLGIGLGRVGLGRKGWEVMPMAGVWNEIIFKVFPTQTNP